MSAFIHAVWRGLHGPRASALGLQALIAAGLLWSSRADLHAQATVYSLGGIDTQPPYSGYVDGNTWTTAKFANPAGMAFAPNGSQLFLADYTNNAIRLINHVGDRASSLTTIFADSKSGVNRPLAVAVDGITNVYVLNFGQGTNGSVLHLGGIFMNSTVVLTNPPLATHLTNATAMAMDGYDNLYVTVSSNRVIRVTTNGVVSTIGTISQANTFLRGIVIMDNGNIALSDAGNHGVWMMNPSSGIATNFTGFHGRGDTNGLPTVAAFNAPAQIAKSGNGMLVLADYGNHKVKLIDPNGIVTLLYGVSSNLWITGANQTPGYFDGLGLTNKGYAEARQPYGVLVGPDGDVYTTETYYHVFRQVQNTGLTPPVPGYPPRFNAPAGIAYDSTGNSLFIANYGRNEVEQLDLTGNGTTTFLDSTAGILNPVGVLVDTNENLYVLNQGTPGNGFIEEYDIFGNDWGPVVTGLNQPTAFLLDGYGNFFVTEQAGNIRAFGASVSNTVVTINTNANVSLQGIALFDDGYIAASDAGNHVIWLVNPITKAVTRLTGQLGVPGIAVGTNRFASLNQPQQLARAGGNQIVAADYGNNRLVLVQRNGTITTNTLNSSTANIWFGQNGDPIASGSPKFVRMIQPVGLAVGGGTVFASETYYNDIRGLTGSGLITPTSTPGVPLPFYSSPAGIALNNEGTVLLITDPTNNTVNALNLVNNQTTVFLDASSGIDRPVDVAADSSDNIYVLNQGTGGNGSIMEFDPYGVLVQTNVAGLDMPTAMKMTFAGDIYVTELSGLVQKFNAGSSNTVANITTNANVRLQGVALLDNGIVVVSDAGNHVIWQIPAGAINTNATLFTGVLGTSGTNFGNLGTAKLNQPMRLAQAKGGLLLIADSGNNRIAVANDLGTISTALNSTNANIWYGLPIDAVSPASANFVPMVSPVGLAIGSGSNAVVFASESLYKDVRGILKTGYQAPQPPPPAPLNLVAVASYGQIALTWAASSGATNYYVKRSPSSGGPYTVIAGTTSTSYTDTGLSGGATYYYVVSALNGGGESANSAEAFATLPYPAVDTPVIGYVTFPPPVFDAVFHPVSSSVTLNNDALIVIKAAAGSQTFYTYSNTVDTASVPDPTSASASAPVGYLDGMTFGQANGFAVASVMPSLSIKAIGEQTNHPNSAIASAQFLFVTANPNIIGDNAAGFTISDITDGARLYYTLDGSDPSSTNANAIDLGVLSGTNTLWSVAFSIQTNTWFKVRAFHANYQPSTIVSNLFTTAAFHPTAITFGTAGGQPHSSFQARPGQFYYAPVTLQLSPNFNKMFSLQFNVTVTNGFTNIINGGAITPVANGAGIDFFSMLMTKVDPKEGFYFPPADGNWYLPIPPLTFYTTGSVTNSSSTVFVNTNNNLLGIGWLFRTGFKYKLTDTNDVTILDFDTSAQDLIAYSIAHDTLYAEADGTVLVGAYSFQVPTNSINGDQYFIQLGSASGTSDGVGAPGNGIYIQTPVQSQAVTISSPRYLVGDVAPFHWLNAGDFGNTNLDNSDVMQVYQSGVLGVNMPPLNSDLYAAMDSAGGLGTFDTADGYWTNSTAYTNVYGNMTALWDGNDQTINQMPFGDGVLDINDLYVTFRRSLDPSLLWFNRFWTNGMFVAVTNFNYAYNSNTPHLLLKANATTKALTTQPSYLNSTVVFKAGDAISGAGSTVQIPITANVLGDYSLRVLGLNVTVRPLDDAPAISNQVVFTPATALGIPNITSAKGQGNFAAAWLNAGIAGLSNNAIIGTLMVTLPPNANASSAYAVYFDFASGSPNGLAVFPNQKFTGLITTTARTNSSYGDGIPDSWRLRWFGTIYNVLSASNACPSGDGVPNWKKFIAGVNPNVAGDFPSTSARTPVPSGATTAIHWPSVSGKNYAIERSTSLFNAPWTILSTNAGTGGDMEFDDTNAAPVKFYRVRIVP